MSQIKPKKHRTVPDLRSIAVLAALIAAAVVLLMLSVAIPSQASAAPMTLCSDYLNGYGKDSILSITFRDTLADRPADAWDVSESDDGSVWRGPSTAA